MGELPFSIRTRAWPDLSERERRFFCDDDYFPLPENHALQICLLETQDARKTTDWLLRALPFSWPESEPHFHDESMMHLGDKWTSEDGVQIVRQWLHDRGIPFARNVYLVYDFERVVQMPWKLVVRYWDALAWSVGYAMLTMDHTRQWACCFHHEDVIVFGTFNDNAA